MIACSSFVLPPGFLLAAALALCYDVANYSAYMHAAVFPRANERVVRRARAIWPAVLANFEQNETEQNGTIVQPRSTSVLHAMKRNETEGCLKPFLLLLYIPGYICSTYTMVVKFDHAIGGFINLL